MSNSSLTIRCPGCRGLSAVEPVFLAQPVECPFCSSTFEAIPDVPVSRQVIAKPTPVVFAPSVPTAKRVDPEIDHEHHTLPGPDRSIAYAVALLPLALPLIWILLNLSGKSRPIFTPFVPFGIGIGATLLTLGAAMTKDWSIATRIKAALAITLLAYATGGVLYWTSKATAEKLRNNYMRHDESFWFPYNAGPFSVKFPESRKVQSDPLFAQWGLYSERSIDPTLGGIYFRATHGALPAEFDKLPDDVWFDRVVKAIATESTGEATRTKSIVHQGYPGREFLLARENSVVNRSVRIFRVRDAIIALSVEGAMLTTESRDVVTFFKTLYIDKLK
ncbi:MAG: hypothetical protein U0798_16145 [Gemmataceae bacterium]